MKNNFKQRMNQNCRKGEIEKIVIAAPCDYELFYKIGAIIENMGASFTKRIIDYNNLYWSLIYSGENFILNYNINSGLYIYPSQKDFSKKEYQLALQIARTALGSLEVVYVP